MRNYFHEFDSLWDINTHIFTGIVHTESNNFVVGILKKCEPYSKLVLSCNSLNCCSPGTERSVM